MAHNKSAPLKKRLADVQRWFLSLSPEEQKDMAAFTRSVLAGRREIQKRLTASSSLATQSLDTCVKPEDREDPLLPELRRDVWRWFPWLAREDQKATAQRWLRDLIDYGSFEAAAGAPSAEARKWREFVRRNRERGRAGVEARQQRAEKKAAAIRRTADAIRDKRPELSTRALAEVVARHLGRKPNAAGNPVEAETRKNWIERAGSDPSPVVTSLL